MTQPQRRALCTLVIWGIVALVFVALFLWGDGPSTWALYDDWRPKAAALVLLAGFIAFWMTLHATRCRQGGQDERDALIQGKACAIALVAVMAYVFFASIGLYVRYESQSTVPAGWLWFLAYTTFLLGWIVGSAASLYYYHVGLKNHA
ncbi:MAG TPA: hypothetical protein DHW14_08550 [Clostridiales bacterium]|nr:hypothetical protein [Clostridiales bacterium]